MEKTADSITSHPLFNRRWPLTLFLLVGLVLFALLVVAFSIRDTAQRHNADHLAIISRLKTAELERWIEDKGRVLAQPVDSRLAIEYDLWMADPKKGKEVLGELIGLASDGKTGAPDVISVGFFDNQSHLQFALDESQLLPGRNYSIELGRARARGGPVLLDLHPVANQSNESTQMVLDVLVPLTVIRKGKPQSVGFLLYQLDPDVQLFPLVHGGPTDLTRATMSLLRREENDLVYLTPMFDGTGAPLPSRYALSNTSLFSVKAFRDGDGDGEVTDGIDYRGVPVIGLLSPVSSLGWYLETKFDVADVYANAKRDALVLGGASLLLLWAMGALSWLLLQSERKKQQAELQVSTMARDQAEDRFRKVVDNASEGILVSNAMDRIVFANPRFHKMLGYEPGTLTGVDPVILIPEQSIALFQQRRQERRQAGLVSQQAEWQFQHKDGSWVDIWVSASPLRNVAGEYNGSVVMVTDISELKKAERAQRESEERFRTIFDSVEDAIFIHDTITGEILDVNRRACVLYGYSQEEIKQLSIADLSSGEAPYTQQEALVKLAQPATERQAFPWHGRRKDGTLFWAEITIRDAILGGHERLLVGVRDISRRRAQEQLLESSLEQQRSLNQKLEEAQGQLLQSEKMASIGQLAAGVAHELNNPISFVFSNLGTLKDYLEDIFVILATYAEVEQGPVDAAKLAAVQKLKADKDLPFLTKDIALLMDESRDGLNRVRKIVQDLKDFSRVGEANWQWADLHKGLDSTLNIVWNELKYKCTVTKHYGDLPEVYCLPSQLNQVFMNLLVNAGQAIEQKGEITIASGVSKDDQGRDQVWISVGDTGKGITEENLKRIFEPFFTTKPVGKGTGLGLSLSYGIVRKHQGRIDVTSEVGIGTTFTVVLPVQPDVESAPEEAQ